MPITLAIRTKTEKYLTSVDGEIDGLQLGGTQKQFRPVGPALDLSAGQNIADYLYTTVGVLSSVGGAVSFIEWIRSKALRSKRASATKRAGKRLSFAELVIEIDGERFFIETVEDLRRLEGCIAKKLGHGPGPGDAAK